MSRPCVAALVFFAISFPSVALAQISEVTNATSTPIPGADHDYIKMLSEFVNPANGSVSLRLEVPTPTGRGLTVPFAFSYDSNGVHSPGYNPNTVASSNGWYGDADNFLRLGGWAYSVPYVTAANAEIPANPPRTGSCAYVDSYLFNDPTGGRHSLGLAIQDNPSAYTCYELPQYLSKSGDRYQATASSTTKLLIADADGTVYNFTLASAGSSLTLPTSLLIEDRNGNEVNVAYTATANGTARFAVTDSIQRPLISSSGFGSPTDTISLYNFSSPFYVTWGTASYNFTPTATGVVSPCAWVGTGAKTVPAVTTIELPNGRSYKFQYDTTYGVLKQITYPDGGYVAYQWGYNPQSGVAFWAAKGGSSCSAVYDVPAIVSRTVSFDGQTVAQVQDFTYSTNSTGTRWTSKQTTVTTYDYVRGTNFQTVYTYSPAYSTGDPPQPLLFEESDSELPVEQTIVYKDTNGAVLRTVTKGWYDPYELACELDSLDNGLTRGAFYTYGPGAVITDKTEYDYGLITSTTVCQSNSTSPAGITPTRETKTAYQGFAATPIYPSAPAIFDRPSSTVIYGAGTRIAETDYSYDGFSVSPVTAIAHDDANYGPSYNVRGNTTTITNQCFPSCANAVTTLQYDQTGQVLYSTDPCGNVSCSDVTGSNHTTAYSYTDSYTIGTPPGNTNAYLTKISYPTPADGVAQTKEYSYSYLDAHSTVSTDENGLSTTYTYGDPLDRLTQIVYPTGGGETVYTYNDAAPTPSVTTQRELAAGTFLTTVSVRDGMGHVTQTALSSDPGGTARSLTTYDGVGKPYYIYNPTRCSTPTTNCGEATWGYTSYVYDSLGRTKVVTNPDGSTVQTSYTGRATEVSDEGNGTKSVQRISQTDALGRLSSVCEVSANTLSVGASPTPTACGQDIGGTGFLTSYQYDALNDLTSVSQPGLNPRSFAHDSLARLTSSTNPEPGAATYSYDANGNLSSKTSPKPNQTIPTTTVTATYTYDVLNRNTVISYTDGTAPIYSYYDQNSNNGYFVGRLTMRGTFNVSGNAWFGMAQYSYDTMGRVNAVRQCVVACGSFYTLSYTYDLLGDMLTSTNGAGVTLTYGYNSAAQLTSVTSSLSDANHPSSLLSSVLYNAPGGLTSASMGTITSTSGLAEARTYNNRLRTLGITTSVNTPTGAVGLESVAYGYAPDGDVISLVDGPTGNWTFTYDDFNRLKSTVVPGFGTSPYVYAYDRYGNRWNQTANGSCTAGTASCISFDANNHVTGGILTYDAAGNVTADNMHHYTYDAQNHLTQVDAGTTASYLYDGSGQRVQKTTAGTTVNYLYNLSGQVVTELSSTGTWNRGEVYAGGRHLVTYRNGLTYFSSVDALGSERVRSTQTESSYESCVSLPFGDGQSCFGSAAGNVSPLHFTGKERDTESDLDNFGARYYSSSFGLWTAPDWSSVPTAIPYANPANPQTLNLYAMVRDNPETFADLNGHGASCDPNHDKCNAHIPSQFGSESGGECILDGAPISCAGIQEIIGNKFALLRAFVHSWLSAWTRAFDSLGNYTNWSPDQGLWIVEPLGDEVLGPGQLSPPSFLPPNDPTYIDVYITPLSPYQRFFHNMNPDDRYIYDISITLDLPPIGLCGALTILAGEAIISYPPASAGEGAGAAAGGAGVFYSLQDKGCS